MLSWCCPGHARLNLSENERNKERKKSRTKKRKGGRAEERKEGRNVYYDNVYSTCQTKNARGMRHCVAIIPTHFLSDNFSHVYRYQTTKTFRTSTHKKADKHFVLLCPWKQLNQNIKGRSSLSLKKKKKQKKKKKSNPLIYQLPIKLEWSDYLITNQES